jgi:hypothetical protein
MVHVMLFPMTNILHIYISTTWSMCTMPRMAVFCSHLISCLPVKSLRYLMNDVEMVPVAHVITVITHVFTFYIQCISTAMSLCIVTSFRFLSWSQCPEIAMSTNRHVPDLMPHLMMSSLLWGMVVSFHLLIHLNFTTVSTNFGT